MTIEDEVQTEHDAWRSVCGRLLLIGAVTEEDLSAVQSTVNSEGTGLLASIRHWADCRAYLARMAR